MIGKALSHYRVTAKLGEGGMGEVYRATDTRLGREVAIKVLPAEMAGSQERLERFRREARALAALDHPGIVTVYSVEESDGIHFLTMQLVDGEPLDQLVSDEGLDVARIIEIGAAIAEALAAAHARGIVHRDLKPANVMVAADGRVKVLDFGLAKIAAAESTAPVETEMPTALLTREGVVMGTVPYMSPEQIAGRSLDPRTDLFSLGVLLYEVATGRRPFSGESSAELASAILRDRPSALVEQRRDLPHELAQAIERCLEKDPEARFGSARELREALLAAGAAGSGAGATATRIEPPTPVPPSDVSVPASSTTPASSGAAAMDSGAARAEEGFWVAVLPFRYAGQNPEVGALAEGLSEEIVTGLSRFSYLKVVARSTMERFAGEGTDARSVGKEIGARYVLEGSLRQVGRQLRLAAQLIDLESGAHLWAETYDRDFDAEDIFELQDELVPRIVSTVADMNGVLPRSMSEAVRSRDPEQLSPYEAVLRSFGYLHRLTADEMAAARSALELAVRKAPGYADAWAMLAFLCGQEYGQGFELLADPLAAGADAAQRAVEAGPSNHLAYLSLAQVLFFQKELERFRNAAERAAALNPMDGNSIAFLGEMLTYAGDHDRGLELATRAKELNPNHPDWYWYTDFHYAFRQGDDRGALAFLQRVNLPNHLGLLMFTTACYGNLGEREAAERSLEKLLEIRPDFAAIARPLVEKWWDSEYNERVIEGLRKAGLEIPDES